MVTRVDGPEAGPQLTERARPNPVLVGLARIRRSLQTRPKLWQETVLLVAGFGLYSLIQKHVPYRREHALGRGEAILRAEVRWGIDALHPLNHWLAAPGRKALAVLANYYYVAMHFAVPAAVLLWLILRHIDRYRAERRVFVLMSLVGLAVFWFFPTAPPRLVAGSGVIDTTSLYHTIGSYEGGATAHAADQYASMPSLHVAYALWVAVTMYRVGRHRWVRLGWFVYPVLTSLDVLATGNHYVLDIPAGVGALGLGYLISWACSRAAARYLAGVPAP